MDDFAERAKASLENLSAELWFPELTPGLTARQWAKLGREIGLTPKNYGTARVMAKSISAPLEIVTSLNVRETNVGAISIEVLPEEFAVHYKEVGVRFYSSEGTLNTTVLACLEDAVAMLSQVPSLMKTVFSLVRSLHVIEPKDTDHDVSFSEPHIPFSIFVSVFEERVPSDALRVAEAIVHEAMHLQLTLIERIVPLVALKGAKYYSPWRQEYRDAQGLLHGLYVFRVIAHFLSNLRASGSLDTDYTLIRAKSIFEDIKKTQSFSQCTELTPIGSVFVNRLLQRSL